MTLLTSKGIARKHGSRWTFKPYRSCIDELAVATGVLLVAIYCANYWSQVPMP